MKKLAISLVENALNITTPTGGKKKDRLTEREIKALIHKAELEIQGELTKKDEQEEGNQNPPAAPIAKTLKEKPGDQHQTDSGKPGPLQGIRAVLKCIGSFTISAIEFLAL